METRTERDSLGERHIPTDAYYGIHTDRALENFSISGLKPRPAYVEATVHIKKAAAIVNRELGLLDSVKADAIVRAADEILAGKLREWFVVDVYQAGAGTSHNMNTNEVIANRAIELLGGRRGDYHLVHPNDDVNMAQSSNDVCPTALRIAALTDVVALCLLLVELERALGEKAKQFDGIIKSGRTHLADAVPIRLGQEFGGWATNVKKHRYSLDRSAETCKELGIGGTAVGTGLNAHPKFSEMVVQELSRQVGIQFSVAENTFEAMQSMRPFVELSGGVRNLAQDLIRISNDLRLLGSGPNTGLREIALPAVQPGSSIMPGKVNPVLAEMMDMVCFQVVGCDTTVLMAAQAGQLELNVMLPVVAYNLLHEMEILTHAIDVYTRRCIRGITANEARCREFAEASVSNITALSPYVGYSAAAEIAKESIMSGKSIHRIALERGLVPPDKLDEILNLHRMTEPGLHEKS
jgi:aspartate ammonia-lyase